MPLSADRPKHAALVQQAVRRPHEPQEEGGGPRRGEERQAQIHY